MTRKERTGLIGVGNIGHIFARRLLEAGHGLIVFDRNAEAMDAMRGIGADAAESATEVADKAEIVLLSLPTPAVVRAVAEEIAKGGATRVLADLSTTGPAVTEEVAELLSGTKISLIGAPVSGGTANAEHGRLAIMAGGDRAAFDRIKPVLDVLGNNVFFVGENPALGQTMKIINNTLYATSMISACEALVYGVKSGLDPQAMLDVINVSSGRSFATMERIPQCALDGSFPVRFATELLHKDVKLCIDDAERIGVPMRVNPIARQFLHFAMTQGDGGKDNVEVLRHIEKWAGAEFRARSGDDGAA